MVDFLSSNGSGEPEDLQDTLPRASPARAEPAACQTAGERPSRPSSEPPDRESLEVKLEALIEEMRGEMAAEQAAVAGTKGPSVHLAGFLPPTNPRAEDAAAERIIVDNVVDPRQESTVVGRHLIGTEMVLEGVLEEESASPRIHVPLTRSDAPVERMTTPEPAKRRRSAPMLVGALFIGVAATWLLMTHVAPPGAASLAHWRAQAWMDAYARAAEATLSTEPDAPEKPTLLEKGAPKSASVERQPRAPSAVTSFAAPKPKPKGPGPLSPKPRF